MGAAVRKLGADFGKMGAAVVNWGRGFVIGGSRRENGARTESARFLDVRAMIFNADTEIDFDLLVRVSSVFNLWLKNYNEIRRYYRCWHHGVDCGVLSKTPGRAGHGL